MRQGRLTLGGREDALRLKARAVELLPDAQSNMAKLQVRIFGVHPHPPHTPQLFLGAVWVPNGCREVVWGGKVEGGGRNFGGSGKVGGILGVQGSRGGNFGGSGKGRGERFGGVPP